MRPFSALISALLNGAEGATRATVPVRFAAALITLLVFSPGKVVALDVVYVMRHAQKAPRWADDNFTPLTQKGADCAKRRAADLHSRGRKIAAVYSIEMVRTIATGMAVGANDDKIEIIGDNKIREASTREYLQARHPGLTEGKNNAILIVAQSGDIRRLILSLRPDTSECLKDKHLPELFPQEQYGDLWVINMDMEVKGCTVISWEAPLTLGPGDEKNCGTP